MSSLFDFYKVLNGRLTFIDKNANYCVEPLGKAGGEEGCFYEKVPYNKGFLVKGEYSSSLTILDAEIDFDNLGWRELTLTGAKSFLEADVCSSKDESHYSMNGVFVSEDGDVVGTDGRVLYYNSPKPELLEEPYPSNLVNVIWLISPLQSKVLEKNVKSKKPLPMFIGIYQTMVFLKVGDSYYSSKIIDGQFPNYHRVIPEFKYFGKDNYIKITDEIHKAIEALKPSSLDFFEDKIFFRDSSDNIIYTMTNDQNLGKTKDNIPVGVRIITSKDIFKTSVYLKMKELGLTELLTTTNPDRSTIIPFSLDNKIAGETKEVAFLRDAQIAYTPNGGTFIWMPGQPG